MSEERIKQPEVVMLDLDTIDENKLNPRIIRPRQYQALTQSLVEFGNVQNLVYNKRSGRVVGGNQRLKILKAHGVKKSPGMVVDLSDDEELALLLVLNNQMVQGSWDLPKAIEKIEEIKKSRPDYFDKFELGQLRREIESTLPKREKEGGQDLIPEMEIEPFEHWDYVVLVFRDSRDWLAAVNFLEIKKVKIPIPGHAPKVGLGRVIDGRKFLEKVGIK